VLGSTYLRRSESIFTIAISARQTGLAISCNSEHHSIHHQLDLHDFSHGDITWWDRLFGTFREANEFTARCGFPDGHATYLGRILIFKVSY